jgi:aerobic-type carbon monoxide dehydrogenase small subunit (CoxS/CutS family)
VVATGHRVAFQCDGVAHDLECEPGESLLDVLRERLGLVSVKDGCAPQGQCGCCTVLVDGEPRVACVTPIDRVADRAVTTLDGLDASMRDRLVDAFVATGASQCGFCTPGILVRAAALIARGKDRRTDVDRALAAHLCRCTGWQTIYEAIALALGGTVPPSSTRAFEAAARRAELEGGVPQRVGSDVPRGEAGFADDTAPRDALVAVPAANGEWVVAESLAEARERAGKVQGRRTTVEDRPPLALPTLPEGGVRLATSWVEPAYLEPDASWCEPGCEPATPLANGGAFGGKEHSLAPIAARELADQHGRAVRVVYSREDCVRLGPKRPPIAASAVFRDGAVHIDGAFVGTGAPAASCASPYAVDVHASWDARVVSGPSAGMARALRIAEECALVEGALHVAGVERATVIAVPRVEEVLLDAVSFGGHATDALAGARVVLDDTGAIERVEVRVAAGDPLDEVVLRSYCIGAAHMALGWVCSEGLAVEPDTGEVLDLTIRSFGVIRPARTPPIAVTILDDPLPPQPRASDAVFAAVAAATWNSITDFEGTRPELWPARETAAARALRR